MYGSTPQDSSGRRVLEVGVPVNDESEGFLSGEQTSRSLWKSAMLASFLTLILVGAAFVGYLFWIPKPKTAPATDFFYPKCDSSSQIFVDDECKDRAQFLFSGEDRAFVFENKCPFRLWIAGTMDPKRPVREELTGWMMEPFTTTVHSIAPDMQSIRYWARTDCGWKDATISQNGVAIPFKKFYCETGDCSNALNGYGIPCKTGSGLPPATLVEFSLSSQGNDFYDLSNVDGYNVGLRVEPIGPYRPASVDAPEKFDCGKAKCVMDARKCPKELKKVTASGNVVCLSICKAIWDEEQRKNHTVLQDLFTRKSDRGFVRDSLCCDCGNDEGMCEALGSPCTYGCSPFVDNYVDPGYKTRLCNNIKGTFLPDWPPASNGENYAAVFEKQCPEAYSWQFNDDQSTFQCKNADYRITFFVNIDEKFHTPGASKGKTTTTTTPHAGDDTHAHHH